MTPAPYLSKITNSNMDPDTKEFYTEFIQGIHNIRPIQGFEIGINTGSYETKQIDEESWEHDIQNNITIIKFKEFNPTFGESDRLNEFFHQYLGEDIFKMTYLLQDTLIIEMAY